MKKITKFLFLFVLGFAFVLVGCTSNLKMPSSDAKVYGNAWIYENARVYGDAEVSGFSKVYGDAEVYGDTILNRFTEVY